MPVFGRFLMSALLKCIVYSLKFIVSNWLRLFNVYSVKSVVSV